MTPRHSGRIITCSPAESRARRDQARTFLDVAGLVLTEDRREAHVAAALAVLDAAHYSSSLLTVDKANAMVRQATALLAEADRL